MLRRGGDVDAEADHHRPPPARQNLRFEEEPRELPRAEQQVVRPFQTDRSCEITSIPARQGAAGGVHRIREGYPRHEAEFREMIRQIAGRVVLDGQFDECDLTFHDLERVIESFVASLVAIYHRRVDYPTYVFERSRRRGRVADGSGRDNG